MCGAAPFCLFQETLSTLPSFKYTLLAFQLRSCQFGCPPVSPLHNFKQRRVAGHQLASSLQIISHCRPPGPTYLRTCQPVRQPDISQLDGRRSERNETAVITKLLACSDRPTDRPSVHIVRTYCVQLYIQPFVRWSVSSIIICKQTAMGLVGRSVGRSAGSVTKTFAVTQSEEPRISQSKQVRIAPPRGFPTPEPGSPSELSSKFRACRHIVVARSSPYRQTNYDFPAAAPPTLI